MIFASFWDSFKYFHTADMFAALVRASIWSSHIIVQYNLFGLFAYYLGCTKCSATEIIRLKKNKKNHSVHP